MIFRKSEWTNEPTEYRKVYKRKSKYGAVIYEARVGVEEYNNPIRFIDHTPRGAAKQLDLYLLRQGEEQVNNTWTFLGRRRVGIPHRDWIDIEDSGIEVN